MIYLLTALVVLDCLIVWWIWDRAWQDGFSYGYSAGLLADDKLEITFEEMP